MLNTEHVALNLDKMGIVINKIGLQIWVMQKKFGITFLDMLIPEVIQKSRIKNPINIRIAQKYFRVSC